MGFSIGKYIALSYLRMFPIKPLRCIVVLFRYPLLSLLLSSEDPSNLAFV